MHDLHLLLMDKIAAFHLLLFVVSSFGQLHNDTCIVQPSLQNCSNYKIPSAYTTQDVKNICQQDPTMPGCSVNTICAQSLFSTGKYCNNFSILKVLCNDESGNMTGCEDYSSMCGSDSVVNECNTEALPLPSSTATVGLISSICSQMDMVECSTCPSNNPYNCDLLVVYSNLCLEMTDMTQCKAWSSICNLVPDWPICAQSSSNSVPQMRMYFHTGIVDYVLFKGWVPKTSGEYAGTWFAVCLMTIISECLKAIKCYWKYKEKKKTRCRAVISCLLPNTKCAKAVFRVVEVAWGFLVMLVVMNYNVGLFFALLTGVFIGHFCVEQYIKDWEAEEETCCSMPV